MAATWARVAFPCGWSWSFVTPLMSPSATAQDMASSAGAWLVGVAGEVGSVAHVFTLVRRVVHEDGGELFAGDGGVWSEGVVLVAIDNADVRCPVHSGAYHSSSTSAKLRLRRCYAF